MKNLKLYSLVLLSTIALYSCGDSDNTDTENETETDSTVTVSEASGTDESTPEIDEKMTFGNREGGPRMTFKEVVYDFGEIQKGDIVKHTFEFTNTGEDTLLITDARASCGCTTSKWSKDTPILPGESSEMEVQFNSTYKSAGPHEKDVRIAANVYDVDEPVIIKIKATVVE